MTRLLSKFVAAFLAIAFPCLLMVSTVRSVEPPSITMYSMLG